MFQRHTVVNISTFTVVLILFGYQFVTSIFGSVLSSDNSRIITIPFRTFEIFMLTLTFCLNMKYFPRRVTQVRVIWIYWVLLLVRCVYDIFYRADIPHIDTNMKNTQLLVMLSNALLPSFVFYKCYHSVDFEKLFKWCIIIVTVSSFLTGFVNTSMLAKSDIGWRVNANAALNTISTGQLGLSGFILSGFLLINKKLKTIWKILVIGILIMNVLIIFRAGSRGPILTGIVVVGVYLLGATRYKMLNISLLSLACLLSAYFINYIEHFVYEIAPVIHYRLFDKTAEEQLYGRDILYEQAYNAFLSSPIYGEYFALYSNGGMWWCHNIILESMMQLGIIGLILMLYIIYQSFFKTVTLISNKDSYYWLALLLIQGIMFTMTSGNFYTNEKIAPLYILLFLSINKQNKLNYKYE